MRVLRRRAARALAALRSLPARRPWHVAAAALAAGLALAPAGRGVAVLVALAVAATLALLRAGPVVALAALLVLAVRRRDRPGCMRSMLRRAGWRTARHSRVAPT